MDVNGIEGVGGIAPGGLEIGGLGNAMFIGGRAIELAKFIGILLGGIADGIGLDEEPAKPRRA